MRNFFEIIFLRDIALFTSLGFGRQNKLIRRSKKIFKYQIMTNNDGWILRNSIAKSFQCLSSGGTTDLIAHGPGAPPHPSQTNTTPYCPRPISFP